MDDQIAAQIDALHDRALAMARGFEAAAERPSANEADRLNAESAAMIIDLAREKSELLPREEVDRRIAQIEEAQDPEIKQRLIASMLVWFVKHERDQWTWATETLAALARGEVVLHDRASC